MLRLLAAASIVLGSLCFSTFVAADARAQPTPPVGAAPDGPRPDPAPPAKPQDIDASEKNGEAKTPVLTILVAGDSIADGIWGGLYRMLQRDKRFNIIREAKNSSGFTAFDWVAEMQGILKTQRADAIVFVIGANDRQTLIVRDKPRTLFRTKEWLDGYGERVSDFIEFVKSKEIPLVWIGLPIARKDDFNKDSQYLNDIYAAAAKKHGILFLDIWTMFMNKDGEYSAYLPDASGKNQLVRHNDGVHFMPAGYELIAEQVLAALRRTVPAFRHTSQPPSDKPAPAPGDAQSDAGKSGTKPPQSAEGDGAKRVDEPKNNDDTTEQGAPEMNAVREPPAKNTRKR